MSGSMRWFSPFEKGFCGHAAAGSLGYLAMVDRSEDGTLTVNTTQIG